ncbi:MAG TPA: PEGA domain-containing protein [Vicinamibacteria bacterium]|nr:PEGA domain-containing protein [Vicinamibacteria bacterium]
MSDDGLIHPEPFEPRPLRLGAEPRARRRLPRGILGGAPLILLVATALFAARAVEIEVEPEPDQLTISGLQLRLGGIHLLFTGPHTLRAEKGGYRPLEAAFEVTRDPRQVARFELERLPSFLALEVEPASGVRVFVGAAERGTTPMGPIELPPGDHEVVLRAEGYAAYVARITAQGGGDTPVLRATLVPDRASVRFASEPAGAEVRVDGVALGQTPLAVDLTSGVRGLEVALPGFRKATRRIEVIAGTPLVVPMFRLEPLPGRLSVTSEPPGAVVSVDGAFRGETPVELELPAGRAHGVKVTKVGHDGAEARVTLARGEERTLELRLVPQLGEVQVVAEPADADVIVDGELKGSGSQTLRLTAAPHEIEARREGYETQRARVTPRPGFPQTLGLRLRTQKQAAVAARPAELRPASGHELRLLSGGRFQMGASRREPGRRANETQREVELARPSYLGTHEVTNVQFRRFSAAHDSGRIGPHDLGGDTHPVVQVTWEQAAEYCNWLSAQEGLPPFYATRDGKLVAASPLGTGYRLPTEAEWSRAARYPGEGPLKYPWGPSLPPPPRAANLADGSARSLVSLVVQGYDDGYPATAPVGSFSANALGVFDLGGNVAEWVHDIYGIPAATSAVERDPTGPAAGDLHVILGSSFLQGSVSELRLSYRDYGMKPRSDVGFRVARYAE